MVLRCCLLALFCFLIFPHAVWATTVVHQWSQEFGDNPDGQYSYSVAVDNLGNIIITGKFSGTVDFGGGDLTSAGNSDIFLAKFDQSGAHLWSFQYGDSDWQEGLSVAVDNSGNMIITGKFMGGVDFGGGTLTSAGDYDIFVAKFHSSGVHQWSQGFGDSVYQSGTCVTADQWGNVTIAGTLRGTVNFGGGNLIGAGSNDIFVVSFYQNGNHNWSKSFGDAESQVVRDITNYAGHPIIIGEFGGTVDFGGGNLTSVGDSTDIFVAKLGGTAGAHIWSYQFGDLYSQGAGGVIVDGSGSVIIIGQFNGTVDFGGGVLTSAGALDIYIAKFDRDLSHIWSNSYGNTFSQIAGGIAVGSSGNIVTTGSYKGTVDFGGRPLVGGLEFNIFVAQFAADGTHICSRGFGFNSSGQYGQDVGVTSSEDFVITGYFAGPLDLGGGTFQGGSANDIYLAKFSAIVIPTLTSWGYLVLILCLIYFAIVILKRKRQHNH